MGNLENLTGKILKEAQLEADKIINEGKKLAEEKKASLIKEIEIDRASILKRAENEANLLKERIISSENLKLRDEKLKARGEIIGKVMEMTKEFLQNVSPESFKSFIENNVNPNEVSDDTKVLVSEKYLDIVKGVFPGKEVTVDNKVNGFILDKKGIMENFSFDRLLDFNKEEFEELAANNLFK